MTIRRQIANCAGNDDIIAIQPVSGGWHRVISVKWRGDFARLLAMPSPIWPRPINPIPLLRIAFYPLRKMTGGGCRDETANYQSIQKFYLVYIAAVVSADILH